MSIVEQRQTKSRASSFPPSGPTFRSPTQRQKLILFLRARGDTGATNTELIALGLYRYSSRIHECRAASYVLESVHEAEGRWRYFLRHEPTLESPPYVFQDTEHLGQIQPKAPVGITLPLFPPANVPQEGTG